MATSSESSRDFSAALSYALSCVGKQDLVLKDKQLETLRYLYEGSDVFMWVPTGDGKFQTLPFLFDAKFGRMISPLCKHSVVLVISPLVSLMVHQVSQLRRDGVAAAILSGSTNVDIELQATHSDIAEGKYRLLYSSPEALFASDQWTDMMMKPPLCDSLAAIAIDEAHCVYKWSQDFRPDYARLSELRAFTPSGIPVLAATATVTELMRSDIISQLDISGCKIVSASPNNPNVFYSVERRSGDVEKDLGFLVDDLAKNAVSAKRVIVYCRSLRL